MRIHRRLQGADAGGAAVGPEPPSGDAATAAFVSRSQRLIVNLYTLVAALYCATFGWVFYQAVRMPFLGLVHVLALIAVCANFLVLRLTRNHALFTHVILFTGTSVVVSLFGTGGWEKTGYLWTFAYLPYVFFLASIPVAWFWVGILLAADGTLVALHALGLAALPYSGVALINFGAGITVFALCMFFFKRVLRQSERLAERRAGELAAANLRLRLSEAAKGDAYALLKEHEALRLRLVNVIAHDLANSLAPVKFHVAILKGDPDDAEWGLGIAALERSNQHMQRLIADLSDMARLESGQLCLAQRPVDVAALAAAARDAVRPGCGDRGIALELEGGGPLSVNADPDRIAQVLNNLLGNAVKFTPAGGRVTLRMERDGASARLSVADTGFGLSADQVARLFKPFSQVHDPAAIQERGTGLGLYICKGIVEGHGGRIGVDSPGPGKGSVFWFTLPLSG
jgi:signal transduction histidine kinase